MSKSMQKVIFYKVRGRKFFSGLLKQLNEGNVPTIAKENNVSVGFNMDNSDNAKFSLKLNANLFSDIITEIKKSDVATHFNVRAEDIGKEVYCAVKVKVNQNDPNAKQAAEIMLKAAQFFEDAPIDLKTEMVGDYLYFSVLSKVGNTHQKDVSAIRDIMVKQGTSATFAYEFATNANLKEAL